MEDLQQALQRILSDPDQMAQLEAMAGALGMTGQPGSGGEDAPPPASDGTAPAQPASEPDPASMLPKLMEGLRRMNGPEERVLTALRSALPSEKQGRIDKALQAARISRLAGQFLRDRS